MPTNLEKKAKRAEESAARLRKRLSHCDICPRNCKVNRLKDIKGYCGTGKDIIVYSAFLHRGEEPQISGLKGSGTIFFSGCGLKCVYCQNYKFSHNATGKRLSPSDLAKIMLDLQKDEAHNINLVTPTHFTVQILDSLVLAFKNGLNIPIVYNTSGYEKDDLITCLDGIVDIYLTDLKYIDASLAGTYSKASDYPIFALNSIREMNRQAKKPLVDSNLLKRGVIIRHLVLPNHINESKELLLWIKKNIPEVLASIMFQYRPYFESYLYPRINRPINHQEYLEIRNFVENLGLKGWVQEQETQEDLAGPYFEQNT